jgi:hypothetical protein
VRNREWMKIDLADFEVSARFDLFHAILTLNFSLTYASSVFPEM